MAAGFLIGLVIGSFLAAVLLRWPSGRSALRGRSQCDRCGVPLRARDLVPILSYLLARGRCRRCGAPIDRRHLAIEIGGGLIGLTAIVAHPMPLALFSAAFGWWLFLVAALDLESHWLPDRLTLPLIAAGLGVGWIGFGPTFTDRLAGAAAGFLVLEIVAMTYALWRGRQGLGGGDPKLLAAIGAWLGWRQLPFVLVGAGLLGLAAIVMMRLRGRTIVATDKLPLGTLMALAAWPIWLLIAT
ncbi:A24 family peptidase [Sphingomonas sp. LY54]|uniref:prepilin peptidase n=1 Tax=Sphingomonas sp. LY54 TaxID=3095343 RepID=UPI002D79598F|nr:A24 family peptidase [Sphingomonas sp. LY54]WRP29260.1 A24 family peptidase [Sphingomonas sp. LY54]